jgi:hypothetical protein
MTSAWKTTTARLAAVACLASAGMLARELRRALVAEPAPIGVVPLDPPAIAPFEPRPAPGRAAALAAVEVDPFRPDRSRPAERFRLPGDVLAAAEPEAPEPVRPAPAVRLIGTVMLPDGGALAMAQLGEDSPRVVRVGEKIGEYVLRTVQRGGATFVSAAGERVELVVPRPGS